MTMGTNCQKLARCISMKSEGYLGQTYVDACSCLAPAPLCLACCCQLLLGNKKGSCPQNMNKVISISRACRHPGKRSTSALPPLR